MMKQAMLILPLAMTAACASPGVEVRAIDRGVSSADLAVSDRLAEAEGHLRLGNVGLAIESYRKALRSQPDSVAAHRGLAAAYDRMGRFDLSGNHYENALALAPQEADLYRAFAASKQRQGKMDAARSLYAEADAREAGMIASEELEVAVAAATAPPAPYNPTPVAKTALEIPTGEIARGQTVTAKLAAPTPLAPRPYAPPPVPRDEDAPAFAALRMENNSNAPTRLERLNAGEVMLRVTPAPVMAQAAPQRDAAVAEAFRAPPVPRPDYRPPVITLANTAAPIDLSGRERESQIEMLAPLPMAARVSVEVPSDVPASTISAPPVRLVAPRVPRPPVQLLMAMESSVAPSNVTAPAPIAAAMSLTERAHDMALQCGIDDLDLHDATEHRSLTVILYPAGEEAAAGLMAARLGVRAIVQRGPVARLTVHLGGDMRGRAVGGC
ncbi:hypothetical protein [Sphingomicrobium sediminis]|uniref:Tetratricopeptide repeat protein n=1 Tax=Sphingomicrobium sediminis TaxID=2950949 RepID=A0A9X2EJJ1_9SPHN|nr:hypothetical protein [Sphingomicrobium sediminis]MCM8557956.1 hypothetical protein [Sphingomicrobium sediminis]